MSAQSILPKSFYSNKAIEKFITLIRDTTGISHNASTMTAGVVVAATILFAWQQIRSTRKKSALASIPVPKGALPIVGMGAMMLTSFFFQFLSAQLLIYFYFVIYFCYFFLKKKKDIYRCLALILLQRFTSGTKNWVYNIFQQCIYCITNAEFTF